MLKEYLIDATTGRLRARTVTSAAQRLAEEAARNCTPRWRCAIGGTVANSYGYPAWTEAIVEVVFPPDSFGVQKAIAWKAELPANKTTLGGAAAACVGELVRPIWDRRFGADTTRAAKRALLQRARADIGFLAGGATAARKRQERQARRRGPRPLTLPERLLMRRAQRLPSRPRDLADAVRKGHIRQNGRWIEWIAHGASAYLPHGDDRDADEFANEKNQERRRRIHEACGDRVLREDAMRLMHEDRYGRLYQLYGGRQVVRVVCPSTGAVYLLPCSPYARTARAAVASTFGLTEAEYSPTIEA